MFSKLKNYKKFNNEVITIEQLKDIVMNNPQKSLIEYARGLEYKSNEYNKQKSFINCIMPHGIFSGLTNDDLVSFSNYLYYDIDGIDTEIELNDTIKRLCDNFPISFLQKSISNKGFHFLIKIDDIILEPNDTLLFNNVYLYVRELLIKKGFNIDMAANGLARKMILSYDKECIFNNKVSLGIDKVSLNNFIKLRDVDVFKKNTKTKRIESITPNDTFFTLIPIKELLEQIHIQTQYTKEIEGDYVIEDIEHYTILLPEKIMDGNKHKLYTRIVNALYYINNNITKQQVLSYLFYVNNRALPPMDNKYLYNFISRLCNYIEETGEIRIKPRIKRIHFNKDSNLTKKQKQIMGAKLNGQLRTNKTREIIQNAKYELGVRNIKITQKEVAKFTGLGIATVKRNWTKEKEEIKIEIPQIENKEIKEITLENISEEQFFNNETETINYRGFKLIEIEKVSQEDKKLFISKINELISKNIEPSEGLFLDMRLWSEEKTWYLYNKWRKKSPYKEYKIIE